MTIAKLEDAEQLQNTLIVERQYEPSVIGEGVFTSSNEEGAVVETSAADDADLAAERRESPANLV